MTTIEKTVEIPENRRLNLELPADTPTGEVNISLTITPIHQSNTTKPPLSSFCGILKNDPIFEGDSVEFQRKMRNEW
jgi:hypothetical protein